MGHRLMQNWTSSSQSDLYKNSDGNTSCILIDTERKVLNRLRKEDRKRNSAYRDSRIIELCKEGRGNNWAMGYNHERKRCAGFSFKDRVFEVIRHERESCSEFSGKMK